MKMLFVKSSALLSFGLFLSGCSAYQLGAVKPAAFQGVDRISVPLFKNETLEPRISSLLTNAVIKQMQLDGTYEVTRSENADAILRGRITRIRKNQLRAVRTDTLRSRELGLFLYVQWHLEDAQTGKRISSRSGEWSEEDEIYEEREGSRTRPGTVIGETIQFVDMSFQVGERNAIAVAAEDAAKKLVHQLSEGW